MRCKFVMCFLSMLLSPLLTAAELKIGADLVAAPCSVSSDSANMEIDFGYIPSATFYKHPTSNSKKFTIDINDCDLSIVTALKFIFLGEEDSSHDGKFLLSGMSGVSLGLEDVNGVPVLPNSESNSHQLNQVNNQMSFKAYLFAPEFHLVTVGEFFSIITFQVLYE